MGAGADRPRSSTEDRCVLRLAGDGQHRWKELEEFLFARAMKHDSPTLLFRLACEYLISSRVVRPGVVLILERSSRARPGS